MCWRLLMYLDIRLRLKLVVAFVIYKIVPFQTLASRVVLALVLWWVIGYQLQLVLGVLHEFGWLLEVECVNIFWFLYTPRWISFCVLAFAQTLVLFVDPLICRASAHMLWHFSGLAAVVLILLPGTELQLMMYAHTMMALVIWVLLLLSRSQRPRLVVKDKPLAIWSSISKRSSTTTLFVIDHALIYFAHFKHSLIIPRWFVAANFQIFVGAPFFILHALCRSLTILFFILSFWLLIFLKRTRLPNWIPVLSVALLFTVDATCLWVSLIHLIGGWPYFAMITSWIAAILFWAPKESLRFIHLLLLVESPPWQGINCPILIFCILYLLVPRIIRDSWSLNQRCHRNSLLLFAKALNALLHVQSLLGAHVTPAVLVKIVVETALLFLA